MPRERLAASPSEGPIGRVLGGEERRDRSFEVDLIAKQHKRELGAKRYFTWGERAAKELHRRVQPLKRCLHRASASSLSIRPKHLDARELSARSSPLAVLPAAVSCETRAGSDSSSCSVFRSASSEVQ